MGVQAKVFKAQYSSLCALEIGEQRLPMKYDYSNNRPCRRDISLADTVLGCDDDESKHTRITYLRITAKAWKKD